MRLLGILRTEEWPCCVNEAWVTVTENEGWRFTRHFPDSPLSGTSMGHRVHGTYTAPHPRPLALSPAKPVHLRRERTADIMEPVALLKPP